MEGKEVLGRERTGRMGNIVFNYCYILYRVL